MSTGSHSSANDYFHPPKFSQLSPKFKELNLLPFVLDRELKDLFFFTTNASLALLILMFLNIHRLFLTAVPDKVILSVLKLKNQYFKGFLFFYIFVLLSYGLLSVLLLSNSENHKHLKNFRNVDCVLANYNKVQDTQENYKGITLAVCGLVISRLVG